MVSKPNIRRAIALRQIKYFSLRCGQFMAEKTVTLWCKSQSVTYTISCPLRTAYG
ncbi:hypothetical protein H6G96_35510 [Nostoc sp. FACHB-892]|nr:hypothetical protein [Nostoc sp. FACHB-892]